MRRNIAAVAVLATLLVLVIGGGMLIAGPYTPVSAEGNPSFDDVTATGTVTVTEEVVIDSKWAVTGPDATTALMVQVTSNAFSAGSTYQWNFTVAFGANPYVTANASGGTAGKTNSISYSALTSTGVLFTCGEAALNFNAIAVGARP
jgi:hypothetical protein